MCHLYAFKVYASAINTVRRLNKNHKYLNKCYSLVRYGNLDTWINLPRLYLPRLYPPRFYQPRYNLGRFYLHRYYPS